MLAARRFDVMKDLPNGKEIIRAVLRAASGQPISDESLRNTVTLEYSCRHGSFVTPNADEAKAFQRGLARVQDRLIAAGLLARPQPGTCVTTPLGEAYLAAGCPSLDAATITALKEKAVKADVAQDEPACCKQIEVLLDAAEIPYERTPCGTYGLKFDGPLRSWFVSVWKSGGWLCVRAHVLRVPQYAAARSSVFEAATRLNAGLLGARVCVVERETLCIEGECRLEHLQPEMLKSLLGCLLHNADEIYPRLFQAATSEQALRLLEEAFKRSASNEG
jgi:hypothetical protein